MPHPQANQKSALGMDGKAAALIGYIFWPIAVVNLIMEKENQFVRFHAIQELFFFLTWIISFFILFFVFFILGFVIMIIGSVLGAAAGEAGGIIAIISWLIAMLMWFVLPLLFALIFLGGKILCAVKAFQGEAFKLPIVGRFASKVVPI
jgi:uncharacterized membrane protein